MAPDATPPPQETGNRFEALFEQSPFSMQLLSGDGRTLRVNHAWEALWVAPEAKGLKEWVLREYNVLTDPQLEKAGITAHLRRAFAGESVVLPDIRYDPAALGQPGQARWVRGYAYPIRDAQGRVREVMLMHEDVSDRVAADAAIRASEMRLKQLANTIPQIAWMADPQGDIHWYNDRWYEYTGATVEDMEGWGWQRMHDPRELPRVLELWKHAVESGEPAQMTFPLRGRDGVFRPFFTLVAPLKDESGRVLQWFGTNTDISALDAVQRSLHEAEERLRLAVLAGHIGTWDLDLEANVVRGSAEVFELHGLEPRSGAQPPGVFMELVLEEDRAKIEKRVEAAIARGDGFSGEYRVKLPDGERRWLSAWGRVQPGGEGRPRRMIGATISIDPYKKAEAALRESDRRKDEFLAMLAHELRNPLAPITTAAEILRMASADPARVTQASEVIGRQVRHIAKLMDDLLDVSRVTRGLVQLEKQTVELASIVHGAIEQAAPLLQAKGQALTTTFDPAPACVSGDRARLTQIVANLLNNASRYTPGAGHIEVSLAAEGAWARLRVTDNGQGIEPDLMPHLFDLFTQGKRAPDRSQGGLGIGLALVKRLVELQGGQVMAQSAGLGKGSTFTVAFPLVAPAVGDRGPLPRAQAGGRAALRVMVVDDNRDAADSLGALLTAMGHEVEVHYDASSAVASRALPSLDAFVLDIGLPDMDGHALARALRGKGVRATLIALTGYGQPIDREQSRTAGFDHHLVKPVEGETLARMLATARVR